MSRMTRPTRLSSHLRLVVGAILRKPRREFAARGNHLRVVGGLRGMRDTAPGGFVHSVVAGTRRRRLAVAVTAALMVVGGVAITRPTHPASPQPAGQSASSPGTSPATMPTASPTTSRPASQSAADASAYGIDPAVAALPIGVRVFQPDPALWPVATSQASTPEGLWLVSRAERSPNFDYGALTGLLGDYGELLLLTPDRSRILRAYPFRAVPPEWLLVTQDAIYCGRQGDGGLPDSMVCRVDRSTGALIVVVFPSTVDSAFSDPQTGVVDSQALAGRPGSWRLAGPLSSADLQHVPRLSAGSLLFARDPHQAGGGKALRLDPVTLK